MMIELAHGQRGYRSAIRLRVTPELRHDRWIADLSQTQLRRVDSIAGAGGEWFVQDPRNGSYWWATARLRFRGAPNYWAVEWNNIDLVPAPVSTFSVEEYDATH